MASTGDLSLEFRLLGTFEVAASGRVVEIGSAKQRALLALLVVHLNRVVSSDTLIEQLWQGRPPASVQATVQSLVYRLRRALGDAGAEAAGVALRGQGSGYVLDGDRLQVDALRFEGLVARGRELLAAGAAERAARALSDALALWRGPALDGLADVEFARLEATRLEEARLSAVEALGAAELARGRPEAVLALLEPHVAAHPLREGAWGQLMVALYRLGRQAEALRAYQELRRILSEELGLEPNPALRQLEQQILLQSPELAGAQPVTAPSAKAAPRPAPVSEAAHGALTTIVFTDVEGSTALRTDRGDDIAQEILHHHDHLVRQLLAEHGGREVKALGDGFLATFGSARRALEFAAALQRGLEKERRAAPGEALRVRIGINAGEVVEEGGDVFGQAVHAAARIAGKGEGGQILVSEVVRRLVGSVPELDFRDAGRFRLKGFAERWRLFELVWAESGTAPSLVQQAGRTPLVGRDAELATLRAALDETLSGSGRLVMLAGEPGIGKTRLTEEIAAEGLRRRALVFVGRCLEAEGAPPYAPFVEILESALSQAPSPEAFRAAAGDGAPEIARLVPRLRRLFPDIGPALALPPEQERRYLFNSTAEMLARTARAIPTVLVLEDLHWADEATLLLLDHLVRQLAGAPVLLIGTYRDVELDIRPALAQTLDGLVRHRLVLQVPLARLPESALAEMLGALAGHEAPDAVVDLVFRETDGNPFFVEEVFRHLAEEGRLLDADGRFRPDAAIGELDVPENVRLVVGRRLDRLSDDARRVLGLAAVIGRTFRYELLEAAADLDDDVVLDAIDDAERARLVVAASGRGGEEFGFVHELVRQTLLARLSAPRRRRLHVAVAAAMERVLGRAAEDNAADVAHHLVEAGAAADPTATVRWLALAGRQAMDVSAFEDALRAFEQGLGLEAADPGGRAALLVDLARAQRSVGRWDESTATSVAAIEAYEGLGDHDAVGRISADAAWALVWLARFADGHQMAQRGLSAAAGRDTSEEGHLLATLGVIIGVSGSYDAGREAIENAAVLADRLGDERLAAHVDDERMHIEWAHIHHREAVDIGRTAAERHRAVGNLWDQAMSLGFVVFSLAKLGRFQEVDELRRSLEPLAQRLGCYPALLFCHRARLLTDLCRTADLDVLAADAARDFEINRSIGGAWDGQAHTWRALAHFWRGDWVAAGPDFAEGMRLDPDGPFTGWGWGWLFLYKAYTGNREGALAMLADHRDDLPRPGGLSRWGPWMMLDGVIEGLVVLGERDEAAGFRTVVAEAIEAGALSVNYHAVRLLERLAGIAAAAGRDWETAEGHFHAALRLADELPHRIEALETRRFYGQMLLERNRPGDQARAAELLDEAVAGYRRLGMPRHADLAEAMLPHWPRTS